MGLSRVTYGVFLGFPFLLICLILKYRFREFSHVCLTVTVTTKVSVSVLLEGKDVDMTTKTRHGNTRIYVAGKKMETNGCRRCVERWSCRMVEYKVGTTWIHHGICRVLIRKVKGKDGEIAGLESVWGNTWISQMGNGTSAEEVSVVILRRLQYQDTQHRCCIGKPSWLMVGWFPDELAWWIGVICISSSWAVSSFGVKLRRRKISRLAWEMMDLVVDCCGCRWV